MDIAKMAENLGLDAEDFSEIIEIYIESTSSDMQELQQALDKGDAEGVHTKAHSIKGASGNLGFSEMFQLATKIDDRARRDSLQELEPLFLDFKNKYKNLVTELKKSG